jgi:hypothetical protein
MGVPLNSPVQRWDLINNVALSDLAAGVAGATGFNDVLVLNDGTILTGYAKPGDAFVRRYSTAGAVLNTYDFGNSVGDSPNRLAYALDDPASFWVWLHLPSGGGTSRFQNVRVSDGAILTTFDVVPFELGVYVGAPTATPTRFGSSQSCPFLVMRPAAPTVPTVVRRKIRRIRQGPIIADRHLMLFFPAVELDCAVGLGDQSGALDQTAPQIALSQSNNGGMTWGSENWRPFGQTGKYRQRIIWRNRGSGRRRVFRVVWDAAVDAELFEMYLEIEPGTG